jgi:hypothetical protein
MGCSTRRRASPLAPPSPAHPRLGHRDVEERTGGRVSSSGLHRIGAGNHFPKLDTLVALAEVLGCSFAIDPERTYLVQSQPKAEKG